MWRIALLLLLFSSRAASAQVFTPPPLIPVEPLVPPPPPVPLPEPPPPPLAATSKEEPPPFEWGRATAEHLLGSMTAAGLMVLPYYLLLRPMAEGTPIAGSSAASTAIFAVSFAMVPLAVASTQAAIANGSRWYEVSTWLPALVGLAVEGLVLSAWFGTRSFVPIGDTTTNTGSDGLLLAGTIGVMPALTTVLINFVKTRR